MPGRSCRSGLGRQRADHHRAGVADRSPGRWCGSGRGTAGRDRRRSAPRSAGRAGAPRSIVSGTVKSSLIVLTSLIVAISVPWLAIAPTEMFRSDDPAREGRADHPLADLGADRLRLRPRRRGRGDLAVVIGAGGEAALLERLDPRAAAAAPRAGAPGPRAAGRSAAPAGARRSTWPRGRSRRRRN